MLKNFFVTSLRILWRNKIVSAINILSLTIGITAFILILLYVHHEYSYDKFNENYDRIYRLEGDEYARLPTLIGDHLRDKIPEIERITLIQHSRVQNFISIDPNNPSNNSTIQTTVIRADSAIFDVFTLPFIKGNPKTALNEPFTIVLTESVARKLFGSKDPMGETIMLENLVKTNNEYRVTGIFKDVAKSHLDIEALISLETLKKIPTARDYNYSVSDRFWNGIYILLNENARAEIVTDKINSVVAEINDGSKIKLVFKHFHLEALEDLYLNSVSSELQFGKKGNGNLLWSFLAIALFVLLLAIINYINLTTARSIQRSKEVIIKKVMGSSKIALRLQFISESIIITLLSFLLAITIIQLVLPQFNQLAATKINLPEYLTPANCLSTITFLLLIGFLSGVYPAVVLTSFRFLSDIQVRTSRSSRATMQRRLLLTVQFSISIMLIIGLVTNLRQLHFVQSKGPGFNKEQVLLIPTPSDFTNANTLRETLRIRLLRHSNVEKIAFSNKRYGSQGPASGGKIEIDGQEMIFQWYVIDPDYMDLLEIDVVEGRNFSRDIKGDMFGTGSEITVLINETAARNYWKDSPVDKIYTWVGRSGKSSTKIIGIVKDFHFLSLHHTVEPMALIWTGVAENMYVRISPDDIPETIKTIEQEWKSIYGEGSFTYSFLDEAFDRQYSNDERAGKIISYFTILAIFIACMGLFALSSFMAVRRTKEIGIRKALGASSNTIFVMLSREYIKWILLSAIIASPIAWFAMNRWLESFAYRIELGPGVFILAAVIALAIGLITVGWQALKSAVANPVEALRYE